MTEKFTRVSRLEDVEERRPTFLAVGIFDGVHLGHQQLLRKMVTAAQEEGARPAVLTFYPHPSVVIRGHQGRLYLGTLDERVDLLANLGLELIVTHVFDEQVRRTRATIFMDRLYRYLGLRELWGGTFGLGYNREGDLTFLRRLGSEMGFSVQHFEALVEWNGELVSSSRVRGALASGRVEEVAGCLGRPYAVSGTVVHGDGRGRQIGVPTANLSVWDQQVLPAGGVYAAHARVHGREYAAAANVGFRPTVNGRNLTVEAHLLDFDEDIYGQDVTLEFVARIRDEQKFPGIDSLVAQIKADIANVREQLVGTH